MSLREIRVFGDPVLRKMCRPVEQVDSSSEGDVEVVGNLNMSLNSVRGDQLQFKSDPPITAAALSGASVNVAAIPAGSMVMGVAVKVDLAVTGATGFDVGVAGDLQRYATNVSSSFGASTDFTDFAVGVTPQVFPAATNVVLTAVGGSFTGGDVTVFVHYLNLKTPNA